jgi:hypothetical protein
MTSTLMGGGMFTSGRGVFTRPAEPQADPRALRGLLELRTRRQRRS